ncbi:pentapeptide repeat-containing protein [Nonomuraea ferruginea]
MTFTGDVSLDGARFERLASFFGARFEGNVSLASARFARELSFHGVTVRGHASLDGAVMTRDALFSQAVFEHGLSCEAARFEGYATFDGARMGEAAHFRGARFGRTLSFRKVSGSAGFDSVRFAADAYLSATGRFSATRAQAGGTLDLAVRGCGVDLRRLVVAGGHDGAADRLAGRPGGRGPARPRDGHRRRHVHADVAARGGRGQPGLDGARPVGLPLHRAGAPGGGAAEGVHVRAHPARHAGEHAPAHAALVLPPPRAAQHG